MRRSASRTRSLTTGMAMLAVAPLVVKSVTKAVEAETSKAVALLSRERRTCSLDAAHVDRPEILIRRSLYYVYIRVYPKQ